MTPIQRGAATALVVTAAVLLPWLGGRVQAHANLVRSEPALNSVVAAPPSEVWLWFDDPLERGLNSLTVLDAFGKAVSLGKARLGDDRLTLSVALPDELPHGTYTVAYRTVSTSDGHNVRGFYIFSIGAAGSLSPVAQHLLGIDWSVLAPPASAVIAWLSTVAALTLTGGVYVSGWLLNDRDSSPKDALTFAGNAPRVLAASAAVLAVIQALALAVYAAETEGVSLSALMGSRFGQIWTVRLVLIALLFAGVLQWRTTDGAPRRRWLAHRVVLGLLGAALLLTYSSQSHAAGVAMTMGSPWPVMMDWWHLLAAAVWFGSVFFLVAMWAMGMSRTRAGWPSQLPACFGVWSLLAAAVLTITGIYQTGLQAPQPVALHDTAYGWLLTLKQALVVAVVLASVAARQALARPDTAQRSERRGSAIALLRVEAVLAAGVLLAAAWLANTAPPREALAASVRMSTMLGDRRTADLQTALALRQRPGGDWNVEVSLTDAEQQALPNAARVTVGAGILGADTGWSTVVATPQGGGRYTALVQWLAQDGPWGMFVTVRRRGVAEDVTTLYGVGVAARQIQPLTYATSASQLYVGDTRAADLWGLVETTGTVQERGSAEVRNDLVITLTDETGGYLDWVERVRISTAPNVGPGGVGRDGPTYREAEPLGPGRFALRDVTMTVLGDWTVRVLVSGQGKDAAAEGFFTFLVGLDGVQSLDGGFPPGHH